MHNILVIQTQHMENYAWPNWDGNGECPEAWKFKGGITYVYYADNNETAYDFNNITSIIKSLDLNHNEAYCEYVTEAKWYDEEGLSLFLLDTDDFWVERFRVIDSNFNVKMWGEYHEV